MFSKWWRQLSGRVNPDFEALAAEDELSSESQPALAADSEPSDELPPMLFSDDEAVVQLKYPKQPRRDIVELHFAVPWRLLYGVGISGLGMAAILFAIIAWQRAPPRDPSFNGRHCLEVASTQPVDPEDQSEAAKAIKPAPKPAKKPSPPKVASTSPPAPERPMSSDVVQRGGAREPVSTEVVQRRSRVYEPAPVIQRGRVPAPAPKPRDLTREECMTMSLRSITPQEAGVCDERYCRRDSHPSDGRRCIDLMARSAGIARDEAWRPAIPPAPLPQLGDWSRRTVPAVTKDWCKSHEASSMTADEASGCLDIMCKDGADCDFMDYIDRIPMRRL